MRNQPQDATQPGGLPEPPRGAAERTGPAGPTGTTGLRLAGGRAVEGEPDGALLGAPSGGGSPAGGTGGTEGAGGPGTPGGDAGTGGNPGSSHPPDRTQAILEATKQVAALLKSAGLPFALAGSVAAYAHGVPQSLQHDTDFAILREDAAAVTEALEAAGIPVRVPPEDWLIKARSHGEEIDLIFELARHPVTHELLDRAHTLPVDSVRMPVLAPTDLVGSLLAAFSEHHCDFGAVLPIARTLREKIDWELLRRESEGSPMPEAFLYLLERLNVIEPPEATP
ncbi:nucleotidyltransferase family protein [Streptomyces ficellus]|uniref:nucleotidyltransferase family protein n=1 Tax=Streptomyces ficellus TaxID=1977088 RepID=UPI001FCB9687|nr:nucleotidyltransferase family protein [Streptomyces ficellus]